MGDAFSAKQRGQDKAGNIIETTLNVQEQGGSLEGWALQGADLLRESRTRIKSAKTGEGSTLVSLN